MKHFKKHLSLALALVLCLSLAACGAKQYSTQITVANRNTYPIVELYAADGDGRGDVISQGDIPVLMDGALPFTNMQNLLSENHEDGTYHYEDITEDGQLLVVNVAEQSCFVPDVQELDDYLTACALSLSDADTYELLSAEENEEYSRN